MKIGKLLPLKTVDKHDIRIAELRVKYQAALVTKRKADLDAEQTLLEMDQVELLQKRERMKKEAGR